MQNLVNKFFPEVGIGSGRAIDALAACIYIPNITDDIEHLAFRVEACSRSIVLDRERWHTQLLGHHHFLLIGQVVIDHQVGEKGEDECQLFLYGVLLLVIRKILRDAIGLDHIFAYQRVL